MNIPEDSDLICVIGPWSQSKVYKYSEVENDIHRTIQNASYPRDNEFKVLLPDGTWKRIKIKLKYQIKIEEIPVEPLTTPPPPPVFEKDNCDSWPPSESELNY